MNNKTPLDQIQDSEVSSQELDAVIDTNKELYDQLNAIPEIEALEAISIEEETAEKQKDAPNPLVELVERIKSFYSENELVRYASWAFVLIFISTTALTFLE